MRGQVACRACESVGFPSRRTRGSFWIELILWIFLIVPGLVYSLWRLSTRYDACASCGSAHVVPVDSTAGARIVATLPPGTNASGLDSPEQTRDRLKHARFGFAVSVLIAGLVLAVIIYL